MRIRVTARGDPDAAPLVSVLEFPGPDDDVFVASVRRVRDMLRRNLRININEAMLLFAAHAAASMRDGVAARVARRRALDLLSGDQVMIGVPDMMRAVRIEVAAGGEARAVSLERPIAAGPRAAS